MLLAAFDGAIQRLRAAHELIAANETWKAQPSLLRAQQLVLELYSGLDLNHGAIPDNMAKLYLFVLNCIGLGPSLDIPAALEVLSTIRNGLENIRDQANHLERRGQVPHAPGKTQVLQDVLC
jgi:flagellin-specific chaperone FliS